jgi:hypothetical protein
MGKIPKAVRELFQKWGAEGGSSKSEAKKRAGKINAAKATAARLAKRKKTES